jgi:hypothetical protein
LAGVTLATRFEELTESFVRIVDADGLNSVKLFYHLPATDGDAVDSSPDMNTGGFDLLLSGYRGCGGSYLEASCPAG